MQDRVPTLPGRVKMTLPDGSVQYVTLERADEPIQVGTPLNKATLLSDATAEALALPQEDPTVNDALLSLHTDISRYGARFYISDIYLYITGQHPFLSANPFNDYHKILSEM